MSPENIVDIFTSTRISLKRSVSVTDVDLPTSSALNLRNTKSSTGIMEDIKASPQHKTEEKTKTNEQRTHFPDQILTKDLYNQDTVIVDREALIHKGKSYSLYDIAFHWKKDYRMWLWKNHYETRRNRSVGDQINE